jgi:hypothetical protein
MDISLTNKEIVEDGMLNAAHELLKNKLPIQTRLPLADFVEYATRRSRRFWENVKVIADKYKIPDNTKFEALTGEAKTEMDFLRNYVGRIQMELIPYPDSPIEGHYELILNKLFVKRESTIKEVE